MKKITLIFVFVLGYIVSFSQNNTIIPPDPIEQSEFSVGVTGAFGHSFMVPYNNSVYMQSWDAGLTTIYSPFKHFGFELDIAYSKEGVKFENNEAKSITTLNYVRIPVKAIYFCRSYDKDFRPKFGIGPSIGFLSNVADNVGYRTIDFGGTATVGFNYRLARAVWLNVEGSYYQGLIDALDGNNEKDLNGNVRLNMGLNFGF